MDRQWLQISTSLHISLAALKSIVFFVRARRIRTSKIFLFFFGFFFEYHQFSPCFPLGLSSLLYARSIDLLTSAHFCAVFSPRPVVAHYSTTFQTGLRRVDYVGGWLPVLR
ncbi:hypothetical protein EVAR_46201_1 [Eumeta japonica]|uniref:Uncharacterized protein n=1 Tax=Eumeta variegata TaxID=151549 RepID=A0A4C1WDQ1_EUMVA|nr:hypothetical protein EVAR_46201_1 [Eumeta japonica]